MAFRQCVHDIVLDYRLHNHKFRRIRLIESVSAESIEALYFYFTDKCFLFQYNTSCVLSDGTDEDDVRCRVFGLNKTSSKSYRFFDLPPAIGHGVKDFDHVNSSHYSYLTPNPFSLEDALPN